MSSSSEEESSRVEVVTALIHFAPVKRKTNKHKRCVKSNIKNISRPTQDWSKVEVVSNLDSQTRPDQLKRKISSQDVFMPQLSPLVDNMNNYDLITEDLHHTQTQTRSDQLNRKISSQDAFMPQLLPLVDNMNNYDLTTEDINDTQIRPDQLRRKSSSQDAFMSQLSPLVDNMNNYDLITEDLPHRNKRVAKVNINHKSNRRQLDQAEHKKNYRELHELQKLHFNDGNEMDVKQRYIVQFKQELKELEHSKDNSDKTTLKKQILMNRLVALEENF